MKKLILLIFLASCIGDSAILKTVENKTEREVVARFGPPNRVESDGYGGKTLIYEKPIIGGTDYRYISINSSDRVYFTRWENIPYQQYNSRINVYHYN